MSQVADLFERVSSGVVHFQFEAGGNRVGSGSGFLVAHHVVTNNHVYADSLKHLTKLRMVRDGVAITAAFQPGALAAFLKAGSRENFYDFAILDVPQFRDAGLHSFEIGDSELVRPGIPVLVLGFPFDIDHLTIHSGMVSAVFQSGIARVFQLDASVNPSNSGGPLVDPATGKVIGIVTRRHTGFTNQFEALIASIDAGIAELSRPRSGSITMMGLDPFQAFLVLLRQLRIFTSEVYRSANVGIGYAFDIEQVRNHFAR